MTKGRPPAEIPDASAKVLRAKWQKVQAAETALAAANDDFQATLRRAYGNGIAAAAIARLLGIAPTTVRYRAGITDEHRAPVPYKPQKKVRA